MTRIGPFFYIDDRLVFNACAVEAGERRGGKVDNPYSHEEAWEQLKADVKYYMWKYPNIAETDP